MYNIIEILPFNNGNNFKKIRPLFYNSDLGTTLHCCVCSVLAGCAISDCFIFIAIYSEDFKDADMKASVRRMHSRMTSAY